MKSFKGTVKKSDLEGGVWILDTGKGDIFQLKGGPVDLYENGKKVTIRGNIRKDILGIGMIGPVLEVHETT
ncbi:MAG: hypothetical protein LWY06_00645 [Firmicutes bacterium]|nr:hypothetical protein [Bacillota bacterium]